MYSSFRQLAERLLRIPHDPSPPPGDEASTRIFRAAPNYYRYLFFLWAVKAGVALLILLLFMALPVVILALGHSKEGKTWSSVLWLIPVALIALHVLSNLFALAVLRLNFEKRWYVVTDRSLRIREGVTNLREITVTFANIQNISISQGPLQRALRIADLRVDTAGGGGVARGKHVVENLHTAWFRGIDNANEVRELIQERLRRLKDSGLGDHEESAVPAKTEFSQAMIQVLRDVHAETTALRTAISGG